MPAMTRRVFTNADLGFAKNATLVVGNNDSPNKIVTEGAALVIFRVSANPNGGSFTTASCLPNVRPLTTTNDTIAALASGTLGITVAASTASSAQGNTVMTIVISPQVGIGGRISVAEMGIRLVVAVANALNAAIECITYTPESG